MTDEIPLEKAVRIAGGQTSLADAINAFMDRPDVNLKQGHIWYWLNKRGGKVPAEYCEAIEHATGREVRKHELRPDIYRPESDASLREAS